MRDLLVALSAILTALFTVPVSPPAVAVPAVTEAPTTTEGPSLDEALRDVPAGVVEATGAGPSPSDGTVAAQAVPAGDPAPEPVQTTQEASAPAVLTPSNWLEELVPQVDPNGYGNWLLERNSGWGTSDGHTVWIDPNVPDDKRYSVVVHEYSHVLQARYYGSVWSSPDIEHQADCMARMLGATWLWYGCPDSLVAEARLVVAG